MDKIIPETIIPSSSHEIGETLNFLHICCSIDTQSFMQRNAAYLPQIAGERHLMGVLIFDFGGEVEKLF